MKNLELFSEEHRRALQEVHNMCCFCKTDSEAFWKKVLEAGEVEDGEPVSQDSFELAMLKAKEILFYEGQKVFARKKVRPKVFAS